MLVSQKSVKDELMLRFIISLHKLPSVIVLLVILEFSDFEPILKLIGNTHAIFNLVEIIFLDYINMDLLKLWDTY